MPRFLVVFCSLLGAFTVSSIARPILTSPDGQIEVEMTLPARDVPVPFEWSARFKGQQILTNCALGLSVAGQGDLLAKAQLLSSQPRTVDEQIPVYFGKADHATNSFHEVLLRFGGTDRQRVDVLFRCYNDAIAFRYVVSGDPNDHSETTITDESTTFAIAGNPTAYVQYLENYKTSHEHNVSIARYDEIRPDTLLDLPLTLSYDNGTCLAITEAALRHYAGMALKRTASNSSGARLVSQLSPRPDGAKVIGHLPLQTPWRVVLIGNRPGALLESETLYCLNDPSVIRDVSWIKPGKITFHWWNGDVYDGHPGEPILSFDMAKKYIDWCARNGISTHSLTSTEKTTTPWYYQTQPGVAPGPDTDVTRPRPGFELERIRQYANSKGVRLWTWVHQGALKGRVEEAFAAFEKMGWSGMMVDFFDNDDQEHVDYAESILEAAARHHILIHFHGVWKPTGWQRTYPNLMNHEGALNLEYLKWSDRCPPEHDLLMSFTRLIAGAMDYHLGGFRAVPRAEFKPQNIAPVVLGTRGHMLGMYVCFDNPNPMVADYPTAYDGQPGFEFIQRVPTWWDETHVLVDDIGKTLVTARRKGDNWYLGGIAAGPAHDVELPLTFLSTHPYAATVWADDPDTATDPNHLSITKRTVSPADGLPVRLGLDGGFAAELIAR